jgi:hypothetical protein
MESINKVSSPGDGSLNPGSDHLAGKELMSIRITVPIASPGLDGDSIVLSAEEAFRQTKVERFYREDN